MIGALSFVYFPYHLFDIYTRGSIGEMLALCITPFVLWQIERKNNVLICLGYGLLILAHNSLAIIVLPILIVYSLLRKHALKDVVVEILCGIGFSAFFWLPALFDKQYTVFDSRQIADFGKYFVNFSSIYLLGLISVVAMAGFIVGLLKKNILGIFFGLIFVISIFLAISLSTNVWHIIPLGKYIQFPFRFLSLTTLCVGFFCAFILSVLKKKMVLFLLLLVLIAYSSWSVLFPKEYQYYPDSWYSTNQASTTVQNEYLPIWVSEIPTNKLHVAQLIKGKGEVLSQTQQGSKIHITLSSKTESLLQINTIYFPGWIVMVDGRQTPIVYANTDGLMQVALNSGNHTVTAFFTETPVRIIADGVSILSIVCLGLYVFIRRKKYE